VPQAGLTWAWEAAAAAEAARVVAVLDAEISAHEVAAS
jgi:hypothetical protein